MPRPAKRNHAATDTAGQRINSFARVSKGSTFFDSPVKKIAVEHAPVTTTVTTRKRKAVSAEEEVHPRVASRTTSFAPSSDDEAVSTKRACRRQEPQPTTPASVRSILKGKRTAKTTPLRAETAHKPNEPSSISKTRRQGKTVQTKLDGLFTKQKKGGDGNSLPPHLAELVDLHRAFVKTIMIQFAHNGTTVPLDIRNIAPHISHSWGKRNVTVEDIRRCIAIQSSTRNNTVSPFIVSDYGRGRVCIELAPHEKVTPINEDRLNKQFGENLQALCAEKSLDEMTDVDIPLGSLSLSELPQVAITNMAIYNKANPLLAKGQQALSELKNGIAAKQQEKKSQQMAISNNPLLNPDGTKMSLLDRLRLKQLAKANGPLPPSGPEMQRRAALNRVTDVAATISMLSLSNPMSLPRQAFTMANILERLKDSLRTPMSNQEGSACIRLIATEVAPEWLRIVAIGGRENVVVQRNSQPVDRVIQERVRKLLA
ncbi:hypothetical protein B0J13DRAFT_309162 [Dactylonectria estremocensis]|uniref:DNA replication factor Cdt1 C-terminal domain-containing protein n=1 Tax=Dactylonectria estremocensis TaxID=1079267 RepID=A0A9P9J8Q2_9HYPO|nr:hypothetical protein B0J13DRAFT_309162 [Dactylonectria estremocensis]